MTYLCIFFEGELTLAWYTGDPVTQMTWAHRSYFHFGSETMLSTFHDWLFGNTGKILGVEFHLMSGDGVLEPLNAISKLSYIGWNGPFPQVWFSDERDGQRRGMEAFPTYYYATETSDWLALLPIEDWLNESEYAQLRDVKAHWISVG